MSPRCGRGAAPRRRPARRGRCRAGRRRRPGGVHRPARPRRASPRRPTATTRCCSPDEHGPREVVDAAVHDRDRPTVAHLRAHDAREVGARRARRASARAPAARERSRRLGRSAQVASSAAMPSPSAAMSSSGASAAYGMPSPPPMSSSRTSRPWSPRQRLRPGGQVAAARRRGPRHRARSRRRRRGSRAPGTGRPARGRPPACSRPSASSASSSVSPNLALPAAADDGPLLDPAAGGQAQQQALPGVRQRGHAEQRIELVERLDGQRPDARPQRGLELRVGLARAREADGRRVEAGAQDRRQLAAGGHVGAHAGRAQRLQHDAATGWP